MGWETRASCIGSLIDFTPDASNLRAELLAKAVCSGCVVRNDCLEDALSTPNTVGIRGGRSEVEREWMRTKPRRRSA